MTSDSKAPIVGIDLGTTYSLVALMQGGEPVVLPNALGELLTPSAVSVDETGRVLVGAEARARATTHPDTVALSFKRDMGTDRVWTLRDKAFRPEELSALVLSTLKRDAESVLGLPVEEAVITVPAYFGEKQRQATRDAGVIAGLRVERIINEPTAAAMAFGLHARDRELRAVVLDLGGGTFDVTVLEIMEGVIEIQSTSGDTRLGGEDFVSAVADETVQWLASTHHVSLLDSPRARARVREACESAKRRLSSSTSTMLVIPQLAVDGGKLIDVERTLGREQVEALWDPLLERIRQPIARALRDAGLRAEQLDEVLLVGGATRMPCVTRLAAQLFGRMPLRTLPPDEAVALGAAVQAALKQGAHAVDDVVVTDVAPFTLGIATSMILGGQRVNGVFTPLIERGTVIPTSREKRFHTTEDLQQEIKVEVYEGEHPQCSDNTKIGEYMLRRLPRAAAGDTQVDVRFTYDLNAIVEVEMAVVGTQRREHLVIEKRPGLLSREQVAQARKGMARLKFHPREALPNRAALARAEALFVELTGPTREELGHAIAAFRAALELQEPEVIQALRERLVALVASMGRST